MDIEVKFVLSRLACIVRAVRWGMMTPKAVDDAKLALEWLGGPDQAGERLSLFLQALANGNPAQLDSVRAEALARLIDPLPVEAEPHITIHASDVP